MPMCYPLGFIKEALNAFQSSLAMYYPTIVLVVYGIYGSNDYSQNKN